MNGELTFWNSGVWLIPLALAATIAGLYFLTRRLRTQTQTTLKETRSLLRQLSGRRRQAEMLAAAYMGIREEPYRTPVTDLQSRFSIFDSQIQEIERQFITLQEDVRLLIVNRGLALVGAPYLWLLLSRRSQNLKLAASGLEAMLVGSEQASQKLPGLAWEVAGSARQAEKALIQIARRQEALHAHNVTGPALENARRQAGAVQEAVNSIPALFREGSEAQLLQEVAPDEVVQVYTVLKEVRPALELLLSQSKEWEQQHRAAGEAVGQVARQLANTEAVLAEASPGLDLAEQWKMLDQLKVISQNMQATLPRLEVESLPTVTAEARRVYSATAELESQVRQARQGRADLENGLLEQSQAAKQLSFKFAALASSPAYPLAWGRSQAMLLNLDRQLQSLGPANKTRTPEQALQALESLQRLRAQFNELDTTSRVVSDQHAELLVLLNDPLLGDWPAWVSESRLVAEKMIIYSPENWPRSDSVTTLPDDLAVIADALAEMVGSDRNRPIDETEVAQALVETRQLIQAYHGQRVRLANIRSRLVETQVAEKATRESLEHAILLYQQVLHLVNSNELLAQAAGNEADRLKNELGLIYQDLRQRERGSVERKARQAEAAINKMNGAVKGWLDRLAVQLETQNKALAGTLAALDAIAILDESPVAQARQLLGSGPAYTSKASLASTSSETGAWNLETILPELKRRCDYGQQVAANRKALGDVADQVVENFNAAKTNREYARQQAQEAANSVRGTHGWPPASISLQDERQEMARLDEQWQALKTQRIRSFQLATQLGKFSAGYQALGDKTRQAISRIGEDQGQVTDLENEYADVVQLWQAQARTYADNPQASKEIRDLLSRAEREMGSIRQGYRQGTRSYTQVLQGLRTMVRNLRIGLVVVDSEHTVDINGRVTRAR